MRRKKKEEGRRRREKKIGGKLVVFVFAVVLVVVEWKPAAEAVCINVGWRLDLELDHPHSKATISVKWISNLMQVESMNRYI